MASAYRPRVFAAFELGNQYKEYHWDGIRKPPEQWAEELEMGLIAGTVTNLMQVGLFQLGYKSFLKAFAF